MDYNKELYAYIGPFTHSPVMQQDILKLAGKYHVQPGNLTQLEQFYMDLPLIPDENVLLALVYTLGEYLWGNADNFSVVEEFQFPIYSSETFSPIPDVQAPEDALLSMQILEKRTDNPLRDYKKYAIILNTLLRKSTENAAVHPVHIHAISSQYSKKIELITSQTAFLFVNIAYW